MRTYHFSPWEECWDRKFNVAVPDRGIFNTYATDVESNFIVVCIHGAGHSALSFSLLAKVLKPKMPVYAPDLKCHGDTPGDISTDMAIDSLVKDVEGFCRTVVPEGKKLILIGHSLGGSIVARVALTLPMAAVIVLDTIEESSLEHLSDMKNMLEERPIGFETDSDAIEFIANSGEMANYESASFSAPGRFSVDEDGILRWKTDCLLCENDWRGWFEGFGDAFLESEPYKILVVPDIGRLDPRFAVAHLNGMFQLNVFLDTNHCVHEDKPKDLADAILKMINRLWRGEL